MTPTPPHETAERHTLDSARRRLCDAGADQLPSPPWTRPQDPPEDATLLRFALWRASSAIGSASPEDLRAALSLVQSARADLDAIESGLLLIARAEGLTWPDIAQHLGVRSPQAAQQRFQRVSARSATDDTPPPR